MTAKLVRRLRNMGNHLSYARMYHEAADCIEALVADRDRCRDACDDDLSERLQAAEQQVETLLEENRNLQSQTARLHEALEVISEWGLDYNAQDLADIARAALQEGEQP